MSSSGSLLWRKLLLPAGALCSLYGGRPNQGLDVLPYRRFSEKVATSNTTHSKSPEPSLHFWSCAIPQCPSLSSSATVDRKREKFKS